MEEAKLDFQAAKLDNIAAGITHSFDLLKDGLLPWGAVALFALVLVLSIGLARSSASSEVRWKPLCSWPLPLRAALWPLLVAYALTHAFSAGSVYYVTRILHPSTGAYFEIIGSGRLLSLSHAHLFAHATLYFLMAVLTQFTRSGLFTRLWAPMIALWAGVFDVVAWWGLKEVSRNFDVLSALCGSSFSLAFLVMTFAILRESLRKDEAS